MFHFFWLVWQGITQSMRFNPAVAQYIEQNIEASTGPNWVISTIVVLGGSGLLLGQSVILFANRVRPFRFLLCLLANGVLFAVGLFIWAVAIWLVGSLVFRVQTQFFLVMRLVGLSAAPFVFGFLVLIPYLGEGIYRMLSIWSMLIATGATAYSFGVGWFRALAVVGLSWLLIWIVSNTIARPITLVRNKVRQLVAGTRLEITAADVLDEFSADSSSDTRQKRGP